MTTDAAYAAHAARAARAARWLALIASLALFAALFAHFRSELIDDAYISLRYARHLSSGEGLVWNPGEPVEGYTDFFWVILLSLVGASREAAWILGGLSGALLLVVMARVPAGLRAPGTAGALLPLVVAAHLAVPYWAAKGLETSLFTLLITAGLLLHASATEPRRGLLAVLLLSLATLTRPEGALFLGIVLVDRARRRNGPSALLALLLAILLLAPHFLFRLSYYGYPLPNTFYAKVGSGLEQHLRGVSYLWSFFARPAGIFFLAAPLALTAPGPFRFLGAAVLVGCIGIVYVGGDAFGAHRFIVPLFPTLCVLTVAGIARLAQRFAPRAADTAAAALTIAFAGVLFASSRAPVEAEEREVRRFTGLMVEVGNVLKAQTPEWLTIALNPCGAIPYYSERRAIDMLGLNDVHIAHRSMRTMGARKAGHEKGDGAYVLSRKPDLILIGNVWVDEKTTISKVNSSRRSESEILSSPEVFDEYEIVLFEMSGGRSLKALARREGTRIPKSGWGPQSYRDIPVPRWE